MSEFTLVLTRGTHTIDNATALVIQSAIEAGAKTVEAEVGFIETLGEKRMTMLVVSHIVAIVEKPTSAARAIKIAQYHSTRIA